LEIIAQAKRKSSTAQLNDETDSQREQESCPANLYYAEKSYTQPWLSQNQVFDTPTQEGAL